MTTLEYALEYIRRGWSVIPLARGSKAPPDGFSLAGYLRGENRVNLEGAIRWWDLLRSADYGIGIVTGAPSDIIVADVDPRNGGFWQDPRMNTESLVTDRVRTGGGGAHWFYQNVGDYRCGPTSIPGVDLKANGGYIVAPPSIHPNGSPYTWTEWYPHLSLPFPPADILQGPPAKIWDGADGPWVADTLANPEGVLPGSQEDTLTRLCWWAAGHLEEDVAFSVLARWAAALPLGNPHDPWTEKHIEDRLSRAYQKREPAAGTAGPLVGGASSTTPLTTPLATPLTLQAKRASDFVSDAKANADSVDWYVQGMVAPGCWTEVIGVMKEGKTTLVGGMLHCLLNGVEFLGRPTRQTNVLWVTEQVGISFVATLERARLHQAENLYVVTIADIFGKPWGTSGPALISLAQSLKCGVMVVDTLARLAGIADEDEARSVSCLDPFLAARAAGIAVIFVRHGRKSGGAINVAARGSGAITGEMDICLRIEATLGVTSDYRHLDGISRLTDTLDLHLEYQHGTYELGPDPSDRKQASKTAPIVQALLRWSPGGATASYLEQETGIGRSTLLRHLSEMVDNGTVVMSGPGNKPVYMLAPTTTGPVA